MAKAPFYRVVSNPITVLPGELTVLFAGESQTRPGHRVGPRIVDYYLLHHVTSGRGKFHLGDWEVTLEGGDTFLIPPGQLADYESDSHDPWRYRWVAFAGSRADTLMKEVGLRDVKLLEEARESGAAVMEEAGAGGDRLVVHTGANRGPAERCKQILDAFLARTRSASMEATGYLYLLLSILQEHIAAESVIEASPLRPVSHSEELAQQAIRYLTAQYAEPVTIEGMAETLGYNRAYLSRLFKSHTGLTPATYLTKFRVDQGRRLLREKPELTVEQVASSVGFQDALYFSKQFKRWYGHTPTDYRSAVGRTGRH